MSTLIVCALNHLSRDDMILEDCRQVFSTQEVLGATLERLNGAAERFVSGGKDCEWTLGREGFSQAGSLQCDHEGGELEVPGSNIDDCHVLQRRVPNVSAALAADKEPLSEESLMSRSYQCQSDNSSQSWHPSHAVGNCAMHLMR